MIVQAISGGEVSMPAVTSIIDSYFGYSASGAGSVINLPVLASITQPNGRSGNFSAASGAEMITGPSLSASAAYFTFDNTSSFVLQNLTLTNGSTLYGSGTFNAVVNNAGTVGVSSGTLDLTGGGSGTAGAYVSGSGDTLQFGGGTLTLDSACRASAAQDP